MMEVLANDYLRTMRINDAPSRAKYFADSAAGDMEKYGVINPKPNYGGLENTLTLQSLPKIDAHSVIGDQQTE